MKASPLLDLITAALAARRLPVDTETRLQAAIGDALTAAGIPFAAEHRLDPKSRIDFMAGPEGAGRIGIEAKIGGSRMSVWRQLERYAAFDEISALVLVGSIAMPGGLPLCGGKPFRFVSVGKGWM